jgi:hypothetical protein
MAYGQRLLNDRLTKIFRVLEVKLNKDDCQGTEAANVALAMEEVAVNILRLESEGLRASAGTNYRVKK